MAQAPRSFVWRDHMLQGMSFTRHMIETHEDLRHVRIKVYEPELYFTQEVSVPIKFLNFINSILLPLGLYSIPQALILIAYNIC